VARARKDGDVPAAAPADPAPADPAPADPAPADPIPPGAAAPRRRLPRDPHARASLVLAERCPELRPILATAGVCKLARDDTDPFAELSRAIVFQQLAGRAAATIHRRVEDVVGTWTPAALLGADPEALRGAGLSRNKLAALLDLAAHVADGRLDLAGMSVHDDEEVIRQLVDVRGIGRWTAEMFLLFHERRLDVWPVGDLGVRRGWATINHAAMPTPKELAVAGERYRPYRSVAAWWCWRAVDVVAPG
jgi:DNA-3-methyladenine glycosylase II